MEAEDLRAVGTELRCSQVLKAYRTGLFPMGIGDNGTMPMGWWSPASRGIIDLDNPVRSRSLRRARGKFEIRVDAAFDRVIAACADSSRPGTWISAEMIDVYTALHESGWVHSVEAWDDDGLAGGLYGVSIGGLFAGESMFHWRTDASKAAVSGLVEIMRDEPDEPRLLDVQWTTPHLESLGAIDVPRTAYARRLGRALATSFPTRFRR